MREFGNRLSRYLKSCLGNWESSGPRALISMAKTRQVEFPPRGHVTGMTRFRRSHPTRWGAEAVGDRRIRRMS